MATLISFISLFLPLILIGILFFVFWIMMLVDSITRKYKNDSEKIVWVLVIIFLGFLGALVYYFVIYFNDKNKSLKWFWWTVLILFCVFIILLILLGSFYFSV